MKPRTPPNAGTGEQNRSTPDSMDQADRTNGEDPTTKLNDRFDGEVSDEVNDDPAITGVQDGD